MRPGGFLTKQASGATAVIAARAWLAKHKGIFRLDSIAGLRVMSDSKLSRGGGHSVTFQQAFKSLKVLERLGSDHRLARRPGKAHRWKIGYVSSTALGSLQLKGAAKLSPAQAWVHAAGNIGIKSSLVYVKAQKVARGWVNLRVGGLRDLQRVKLGSFGIGRSAVPAYESIVLDTVRLDGRLPGDRQRPQRARSSRGRA